MGNSVCCSTNGADRGVACATANTADNTFQWLIQQVDGRMIVLSDTGFHAAEGDPSNLKLCQRGEWEDCMLVRFVLDAHARLSFKEGDASGLGAFSGAPGVHYGCL